MNKEKNLLKYKRIKTIFTVLETINGLALFGNLGIVYYIMSFNLNKIQELFLFIAEFSFFLLMFLYSKKMVETANKHIKNL